MNYEDIGFMSGLEIHQQLDTKKLFCDCPSIVRDSDHEILVTRKLRPVAGESGQIDVAALHEASKGRYFRYVASKTSSCLVELDEEPPGPVNEEALQVALQVAKMLHATVVDEVHVMRKIVVDGSNVSGFQRTMLIAHNGWIETSKGKVGVETICLEEESAQKGDTTDEHITFKLDRLGVPLIEIATEPTLKDPEHVKEAAEKLGMILRSTGKVKRGIGTIRQDVNVSISGGARVEIKGFQDLKSIPKVVEFEIKRQQELIKKGEEPQKEVRNAKSDMTTEFLRPMPGSARMYPETDVQTLPISRKTLSTIEVPELIEDKIEQLVENYKITKEVAASLVKNNKASFFVFSCKRYTELKPTFVAETLLSVDKQVKKQFDKEIDPSQEDFSAVFKALNEGTIAKDSVLTLFAEDGDVKDVIGNYLLMSDAELEAKLKEIIAANADVPFKALIGKAMGELRGKADGRKISEMLKRLTV